MRAATTALAAAWLFPLFAAAQPTFDEVIYATVPVNGGTFDLPLDIYQATSGAGPRPVLVWIHGGGWSGGSHNNSPPGFVLDLRAQGVTVVSVEYRLSGQAIFPAQIQDVKGAVRWLRAHAAQYDLDPARFGAWGTSAGGHLAALLATSGGVAELEGDTGGNLGQSSAIQAAVDYFGPTDIINMNLDVTNPPGSAIDHDAPSSPESRLIGFSGSGQGIGVLRANLNNPNPPYPEKVHLANLVNPITHVDAADPPMYIGHGDSDVSVPYNQSVRLKGALDAAGISSTLRIAPGFGHGALGSQTDSEAAAFMLGVLTGPGPCEPPVLIQPPRGLYCSCPPTNANSHSVMPEVAAKDFVEGTLVRVAWRDLNPAQGSYSWTLLDSELDRARQNSTKVALGVVNGPSAPAWLASQGVQMFNFTTPQGAAASMPVPWDATYLSAWTTFIAQLGARYNDDETITLVHVTNSTANGFEMQLPFWGPYTTQWNSIGYTAQRNADSWRTSLDAFAAAFPSKPLDVEVHPVLAGDAVAQDVWETGHAAHGPRLGLFGAWWSQNNAANAYPGMHALIQDAATSTFGMIQLVTNATNNPNGFGPGGIAGAFDLAYNDGVRYAEVWNADLLNTSLESLLRSTAARFTEPVTVCIGEQEVLGVVPAAGSDLGFQWQIGDGMAPGGWRSIADGDLIIAGQAVAAVGGSSTSTLSVAPTTNFGAAEFRCVVSNACGSVESAVQRLAVQECCDPDVNCDGAVNGFDVQATEAAVNGDFGDFCGASADLNRDGAENGFDVEVEEQRVNGAPC